MTQIANYEAFYEHLKAENLEAVVAITEELWANRRIFEGIMIDVKHRGYSSYLFDCIAPRFEKASPDLAKAIRIITNPTKAMNMYGSCALGTFNLEKEAHEQGYK